MRTLSPYEGERSVLLLAVDDEKLWSEGQRMETLSKPRPPVTEMMPARGRRPLERQTSSIGPYRIVRALIRAPGLWLFEGDREGDRVLLQLARLSSTWGDSAHRLQVERAIAQQTIATMGHPEIELIAHGVVDGPDKTRVLFWSFPWRLPRTDQTLKPVHHQGSFTVFLDIALAMASRLVAAHSQKLTEPLLSEEAIYQTSEGRITLLGIPVPIDPSLLCLDFPPARRAPEEKAELRTPAGDLFRLGWTLKAMSEGLAEMDPSMAELLERLLAPEPEARPNSAIGVLQALERMRGVQEETTEEIEAPEDLGALVRAPSWASALSLEELQDFLRLVVVYLETHRLNFEFDERVVRVRDAHSSSLGEVDLRALSLRLAKKPIGLWGELIQKTFDVVLKSSEPNGFGDEELTELSAPAAYEPPQPELPKAQSPMVQSATETPIPRRKRELWIAIGLGLAALLSATIVLLR